MTDRDLLEAAAKSCGYKHKWNLDGLLIDETCGRWNPITDDGDAFRLAVKLGIHITNSEIDAWASTLGTDATEPFCSDPCAATRRAIVRAAAALQSAKG